MRVCSLISQSVGFIREQNNKNEVFSKTVLVLVFGVLDHAEFGPSE